MQAELTYPLIDSFPESEKRKILERLQMDLQITQNEKKKPEMLSDFEARAYLIKNFLKKKRKF